MKFSKILSICIVAAITMSILPGCGNKPKSNANKDVGNVTYAFVAKDVNNPYMQKVYDGFENACNDIGAEAVYSGPENVSAEEQIKIIEKLTDERVDGIAVDANDMDLLEDSLKSAMSKGIKIISLDSAVNKDSRLTHIQQADPENIGRELIKEAYRLVDGHGGIAILSSSKTAVNQNEWLNWMNTEIEENPEKYINTPILTTVYGDDNDEKSIEEAKKLLENKNISVIIAPTVVGLHSAAKAIQETGADVKLTGLGLPSEMTEYIQSGICQTMYLWNPVDVGTLAAYTLSALDQGVISGAAGDEFSAGNLGYKTVTSANDGGTEVIVSEILLFDKSNINEWKEIY